MRYLEPPGILSRDDDINALAENTARARPSRVKRPVQSPGRRSRPPRPRTLTPPTPEEATEVRRLEERVHRGCAVLEAMSPHHVCWRVLDVAVWPSAASQIANYVLLIRDTADEVPGAVARCVDYHLGRRDGSQALALCDRLCEFAFAYLLDRRPSSDALQAAQEVGGKVAELAAKWLGDDAANHAR
jgi:hypothetical protein